MIIDGETWACHVCVRGHRTGNCQHYDRPLQVIKKKGRPVSQCNHCRSMRQSRSAHVKCECAKKLREGRWNGESADANNRDQCRCYVDGHCICAIKKGQSDFDEGLRVPTPVSDDAAFTGVDNGFLSQPPSIPILEMPGHIGSDSWNGSTVGQSQLPHEQAHHSTNSLDNPWADDPSHTIGGDSQQGSSFDFSGLDYLSPLDGFTGFNTFTNAQSAQLAGLPDKTALPTQDILNAEPDAGLDWIHNGHGRGQAFGSCDSQWLTDLHFTGSILALPPDDETATTEWNLRHNAAQSFPNT